jgi:predicted nuclease of predicted toxin-antitoxin system
MKFLLNMNIPPDLGRRLQDVGHRYRHVADVDLAEADDSVIVVLWE